MTRDPLLVFLGVGLLLALIQSEVAERILRVGPERVEALEGAFSLREGRPPTEAELEAAVEAWVDEELALRRARSLNLDQGDPIVRRRLLQKVALLDELLEGSQPEVTKPSPSIDIALEHRFDGAFAHGERFSLRPIGDYAELFGPDFALALEDLPVGEWLPLQSVYGEHQVRVTERSEGLEPTAPLEARARLEARDQGRERAQSRRREATWVLY